MIRFLVSLLFATALSAQCFTHPFPGVVGVVGIPAQGCNEINGGVPPWLSINAAPNSTTGGPFYFVWNNVPVYATAPAIYYSVVVMDAIQPPPFQFPGTTSPQCQFVVLPAIIDTSMIVMVSTGCQSVFWTNLPPLPSFQGLGVFCQGALWDLTINKFALSKPFAFQFQ